MSEIDTITRDEIEEKAKELGLVAIFPECDEILIDWDNLLENPPESLWRRIFETLRTKNMGLSKPLMTRSKSGGAHYYMKCRKPLSWEFRVVIQTALGSDPVREILSCVRSMKGGEYPTVLFETKLQAKRVMAWRAAQNSPIKATLEDCPY